MKFSFYTEPDGQVHLTKKHGISTALVKEAFSQQMKDWPDGTTGSRIRLCKVPPKSVLKVVYQWKSVNKHAFIITAHYYP